MGVPGLYGWLRSRWPRAVRDSPVGETDNLYIDLNSIVHAHAHPAAPTEEETILSVLHHIEGLLDLVRPRRLLFLAVDGVAPRSKINEQRARRFAAARDRPEHSAPAAAAAAADARGEWDANAITPGTEFMQKLRSGLEWFVSEGLASGRRPWAQQGIAAVVSGSDVAGEGEHKIAQFIREQRRAPRYDTNTRHCLIGNDADLIMLALVTHEPHFTVVHDDRDNGGSLMWIDLAALREYIEVSVPRGTPLRGFDYDLERIVDDFVFLCALNGNDHVPSTPAMRVREGSVDLLLDLYAEALPNLGGYITHNGDVDTSRALRLLDRVADHEMERIEARSLERNRQRGQQPSEFWRYVQPGTRGWRSRYSERTLGRNAEGGRLQQLCEDYMAGLHYVMRYYCQGCPSWTWCYRFPGQAPLADDVVRLVPPDYVPQFDLGHPLTPFELLMAVLPPSSAHCVPEALRPLMQSPTSPLRYLYDVGEALRAGGSVPLVDIGRLLDVVRPLEQQVSELEARRNRPGVDVLVLPEQHTLAPRLVALYTGGADQAALDGGLWGTATRLAAPRDITPGNQHSKDPTSQATGRWNRVVRCTPAAEQSLSQPFVNYWNAALHGRPEIHEGTAGILLCPYDDSEQFRDDADVYVYVNNHVPEYAAVRCLNWVAPIQEEIGMLGRGRSFVVHAAGVQLMCRRQDGTIAWLELTGRKDDKLAGDFGGHLHLYELESAPDAALRELHEESYGVLRNVDALLHESIHLIHNSNFVQEGMEREPFLQQSRAVGHVRPFLYDPSCRRAFITYVVFVEEHDVDVGRLNAEFEAHSHLRDCEMIRARWVEWPPHVLSDEWETNCWKDLWSDPNCVEFEKIMLGQLRWEPCSDSLFPVSFALAPPSPAGTFWVVAGDVNEGAHSGGATFATYAEAANETFQRGASLLSQPLQKASERIASVTARVADGTWRRCTVVDGGGSSSVMQCPGVELDASALLLSGKRRLEVHFGQRPGEALASVEFCAVSALQSAGEPRIGACLAPLTYAVRPYVAAEWIEYHKLLGISLFWLYDRTEHNASYAGAVRELGIGGAPGSVVVRRVPFMSNKPENVRRSLYFWDQRELLAHCMFHARGHVDLVTLWDMDEFLNDADGQFLAGVWRSLAGSNTSGCAMIRFGAEIGPYPRHFGYDPGRLLLDQFRQPVAKKVSPPKMACIPERVWGSSIHDAMTARGYGSQGAGGRASLVHVRPVWGRRDIPGDPEKPLFNEIWNRWGSALASSMSKYDRKKLTRQYT
eukprot:m51a1_g8674 putative 5 -3 exoribonuclease 1 (1268) ;mRNA; f:142931-149640